MFNGGIEVIIAVFFLSGLLGCLTKFVVLGIKIDLLSTRTMGYWKDRTQ